MLVIITKYKMINTRDIVSEFISLLGIILSTDIRFEQWIWHVTTNLLYIRFTY